MASVSLQSAALSTTSCLKLRKLLVLLPRINLFTFQHKPAFKKQEPSLSFRTSLHPGRFKFTVTGATCDDLHVKIKKDESLSLTGEKTVKFLLWASVFLGLHALCGDARAATIDAGGADSIRASGFGIEVANALRTSGWPDEAVVFALATLPVIELRGSVPVGYWLKLNPIFLTVLSVLGNMVPVPFIILYLKKVTAFLTAKNQTATKLLDMFESAKQKAGPVKEFQWLGLMLFVAVPFPGTGAWTGAFIASVLDMPFWPAVSANLVGVVIAALLVNLLVNLGIKYAVGTGVILFVVSTFMWSILRGLKNSFTASDVAE